MDLQLALQRLKRFARSWNDDDVIDEDSMLTGADLRALIENMEGATAGPA